jgi:hypothetical protein
VPGGSTSIGSTATLDFVRHFQVMRLATVLMAVEQAAQASDFRAGGFGAAAAEAEAMRWPGSVVDVRS